MFPVTFEQVSAILEHDDTARMRAIYMAQLFQKHSPFEFPEGMRQKLVGRLSSWMRVRHPAAPVLLGRRGASA